MTCGRWRWWAPTERSTGTVHPGSTLLPCSARCWTPARAVTSRCGVAAAGELALKIEESGVAATFTLEEGQGVDIELEWNGEERSLAAGETEELFTRTSDFWQGWVSQSRYRGRWREMVQRSA
ncbi:MAG TPA: hypothetical protein VHO07_24580, partial [Streptosporangiaceae bacterium]|nr:hypothetical protein [Streptosporangiaceae bacterium]